MSDSTQHKLSKVRAPRVQITYDVETGGEVQKKELPLVVGVMSDLSGESEKEQPKLKDRKFVEIDQENFDDVMTSLEPRVEMLVENKLTDDGGKLDLDLRFKKLNDFDPLQIIDQVPALKKLYEARSHLMDLCSKLDGNDKLEQLLENVVRNTADLEELKPAVEEAPE